jgi:hypothetical protein
MRGALKIGGCMLYLYRCLFLHDGVPGAKQETSWSILMSDRVCGSLLVLCLSACPST